MCDAFDVLPRDFLHATYEHDEDTPPAALLRPTTPLPDRTRTLRRTISYASIDTVCPVNSSSKGIRRRINDIAENLKNKSTKKKKKDSSAQDVPKNATHGRGSESNAKQASRGTKRGRKATAPLRDSSHRSEEEKVLAAADWLHSGVPSEQDTPSTFLGCESDPLVDEPPLREDEQPWEDDLFPTWSLEPTHVTADGQSIFKPPQTPKIGINDVQLDTRPSESDVTIWDGLRAAHHLFKCRLFLRCTTHPYDTVSLPDIRRFEMNCYTHPASESRYARPPILQTTYEGAPLGCLKNANGLPNVKLGAGIHMDRFWRTTREDDGTWGWYRDGCIPLSPRLFDKMEYREFKLVSRVWLGESCVESESTFGISMLLREVEMK